MATPTVVIVIANSLKHSHAVELCQSARDGKVKYVLASIIPRIPTPYYQMPSTAEIEERLSIEADAKLTTLGRVLGIPKSDRYLVKNNKQAIQTLAKELNAYLIIDDRETPVLSKFFTLMTGKKPAHKIGDIPSIKAQEYLDILKPTTQLNPIKEEIAVIDEKMADQADYYASQQTFFSLSGLFNWLAEKDAVEAKQHTQKSHQKRSGSSDLHFH